MTSVPGTTPDSGTTIFALVTSRFPPLIVRAPPLPPAAAATG